jgi:hypothetical protein
MLDVTLSSGMDAVTHKNPPSIARIVFVSFGNKLNRSICLYYTRGNCVMNLELVGLVKS